MDASRCVHRGRRFETHHRGSSDGINEPASVVFRQESNPWLTDILVRHAIRKHTVLPIICNITLKGKNRAKKNLWEKSEIYARYIY